MNDLQMYGMMNSAVNFKANIPKPVTEKITQNTIGVVEKTLIPVAGTLAAIAGVKTIAGTIQNETMKVNENIKQSILFATSRISDFDGFDMSEFIDNNPKAVIDLSEAKDSSGRYIFNAEDMAVVLFNCKDVIKKNPNRISEVLSDPENIKILSESKKKFVTMWRIM